MSEIDLDSLSLEELQAALEKKKAEVKDTKAEQQDWTKMSRRSACIRSESGTGGRERKSRV